MIDELITIRMRREVFKRILAILETISETAVYGNFMNDVDAHNSTVKINNYTEVIHDILINSLVYKKGDE